MTNEQWQEMSAGAVENRQQEVLTREIIRLQERVRALEREQEKPDNAFWAQLFYDAFLFVFIVLAAVFDWW